MSLSRRYRPNRFADVTAQDAIKETLRREVATGKIGHAYIFSGPRGVGKTTTARIFAKALNCLAPADGEPCLACESCRETAEGRAIDFMEIDAASHNGVDMVREAIIEHVRFSPTKSKFKVYVLDEAHMLSTAAWNAMLKTLEEPPSYAIFILATTELHRVPATIVSRCQRFDFKRIPADALTARVRDIARDEGVTVNDSVVASIVRHADGCLRDAETLLDQLLALGEKTITEDVASLVIPVSRLPLAAELLLTCAARELGPALAAVGKLEEDGVPLMPIFDDLIQAVRLLLIAADSKNEASRLSSGDEGERRLSGLVGRYSPAELGDMALLFMERRRDAKQGIDPRFAMELAVAAIALDVLPHGGRMAKMEDGQGPMPIAPSPRATASSPIAPQPPTAPPAPAPPPPPAPAASASAPLLSGSDSELPASFTLAQVQRVWHAFVDNVGKTNASLTFVLSTSRPEEVKDGTLIIRFQYAFHRDKAIKDGKNLQALEAALCAALNIQGAHIDGVVGEDAEKAEKRSSDMVSNILKAFGGTLVDGAASSPPPKY